MKYCKACNRYWENHRIVCPECLQSLPDNLIEEQAEHPAINGYNRYDYIPVEGIRQPKPEPGEMSNITQADIDRAMEIINTPFGGNRGMAILSKSNYMYLCGMVQAMTKCIAELEKPILCAKCNDHIIADDGAVCEICADTMDTIITELQARIKELEAKISAAKRGLEMTASCLPDTSGIATVIKEAVKYLTEPGEKEEGTDGKKQST